MKTITVPKTPAAAARLDRDAATADDLIEMELTGDAFDRLFSSGWVASVNAAVGCMIDDYEDERIVDPDALDRVAAITARMGDAEPFPRIAALAEEAKRRGTGLHVYF